MNRNSSPSTAAQMQRRYMMQRAQLLGQQYRERSGVGGGGVGAAPATFGSTPLATQTSSNIARQETQSMQRRVLLNDNDNDDNGQQDNDDDGDGDDDEYDYTRSYQNWRLRREEEQYGGSPHVPLRGEEEEEENRSLMPFPVMQAQHERDEEALERQYSRQWNGDRDIGTQQAFQTQLRDQQQQKAEKERQAAELWRYTRAQYDKLDALLNTYGLERVPIPADGNCLFHSFASYFDDKQIDHRYIRKRVCDYIDQHRDLFRVDIECDFPSVDAYLRMMRRDREWGDAICANAFCLAFDVNVILFTPEGCMPLYPGEKRMKMGLCAFQKHYTATRVIAGKEMRMK